jgi:hypothetical protein
MNVADLLIILKTNEGTLRAQGVKSLSVFGSIARGQQSATSDVDLAAELAPGSSLLDLAGVKLSLEAILKAPVDLVAEPAERRELQAAIDRDRLRAF